MWRIAKFVERQRLHMEFNVGRCHGRVRFCKCTQLRGRHGERAGAEQHVLQSHARLAEPAIGLFIECRHTADLECHPQLQVVLQVFAYSGQNMANVDGVLLQQSAGTDAGKLQQLRGVDRARRQNGFALCVGDEFLVTPGKLHAMCAVRTVARIENNLLYQHIGEHRQIRAPHGRPQEGLRGAQANARPLVDLKAGGSEIVAAIEIRDLRDPALLGGIAPRVQQSPVQALFFHPPFTAGAMNVAGTGVMVLAAFEHREDIAPRPAGIAQCRPCIVVARLSAHVHHCIDRRTATQHFAARIEYRSAVQAGAGLCAVAPVGARIADAIQVAHGDVNPDPVVLAARLQQQHPDLGIGREAVGEQAAGGAGADDDVIENSEGPGHYCVRRFCWDVPLE